jgi:chromosome segregation ATPase
MTTEPKRRALKWIGTRLSDHRAELVEVRDEVDSMRRAMDERIATAGKALTRLAAERGDLQRERDLLRQSLAEKSRVAARLRSELEQSRATNEELIAAATLPAAAQTSAQVVDDPTSPPEKSGFRHNLAMAGELRETRAELAALRIKLEDAEEDAARSSSRAALGSLPAQAETRALRGELDATRAELVAIKDAFAEAERSWTERSAHLAESSREEIRELRRSHERALAGAMTATNERDVLTAAHAEETAALRRDAALAAGEFESAMSAATSRETAATEGRREALAEANVARDDAVDDARVLRGRVVALETELETRDAERESERAETIRLRDELRSARETQILPDLAALDEMESRLTSLATRLRDREREVRHLTATVEGQVCERRSLVEELRAAKENAAVNERRFEKERERLLRSRGRPSGSQNAAPNGKDRSMTKSMSRAFKGHGLRY